MQFPLHRQSIHTTSHWTPAIDVCYVCICRIEMAGTLCLLLLYLQI